MGGNMMIRKLLSLFSLFVIPAAVLMLPLNAQSDTANPEEVAHMKAGHKKVEGVVTEVKSGLYTVKTPTGTTYSLAETAAVRHGHGVPKVGDQMTLWVNEGNLVIDAHMKGDSGKAHHFLSGTLKSLDYEKSQMTLSTSGGEKNFKIKPETRMFKEISAGAQVTVELNEMGEVIDLHKDTK
jgi:hypothetical protein